VNVPACIGAGAVSVNVLSVVVFCPKSARFLPEAAIRLSCRHWPTCPFSGFVQNLALGS
jgi:hypothetical protein